MSVFRKILRTYYKGMTPFHSVWLSNFQSVLMSRSKAVDQRCSVKKVFLEFSQNSQEKHLCQSLFNKVAGLLKRRIEHRCFPVNFAKFLRTPFFIEHLWTASSARSKLQIKKIILLLINVTFISK